MNCNYHKEFIVAEISRAMRDVQGLSGKWSIDVMKNSDEYWLIDMARMEYSALVNVMETTVGSE